MGAGGKSLGLATACIAGCVATWEFMAITSQGVLGGWNKPYCYTYLVHSSYCLALPLWVAMAARDARRARRRSGFDDDWPRDGGDGGWRGQQGAWGLLAEAVPRLYGAAIVLAALSATCGYLWYRSLLLTNVPTNNVLYQTQCAFVFALSAAFLRERVTRLKVAAVALAFVGVVCVCAAPTTGAERANTRGGVALALISTCIYALYEVAYSRYCNEHLRRRPPAANDAGRAATAGGAGAGAKVADAADAADAAADAADSTAATSAAAAGTTAATAAAVATAPTAAAAAAAAADAADDDDNGGRGLVRSREGVGLGDARDALLVLGLVGLANMLLLWLAVPLLDVAGAEAFERPSRATMWKVARVCASDLVFNALLLVGIRASTPLVMTVGTMAVIPTGFAVDLVRKGYRLSALGVVGSLCVIGGIALLSATHGAHGGEGGDDRVIRQAEALEPDETTPLTGSDTSGTENEASLLSLNAA